MDGRTNRQMDGHIRWTNWWVDEWIGWVDGQMVLVSNYITFKPIFD